MWEVDGSWESRGPAQEEETGVQSFTSRTEIAPESSPDSTVGSDALSVRSNGRLGLADRVVRKYLGCTNCTKGPFGTHIDGMAGMSPVNVWCGVNLCISVSHLGGHTVPHSKKLLDEEGIS